MTTTTRYLLAATTILFAMLLGSCSQADHPGSIQPTIATQTARFVLPGQYMPAQVGKAGASRPAGVAEGCQVPATRVGFGITESFDDGYIGRMFISNWVPCPNTFTFAVFEVRADGSQVLLAKATDTYKAFEEKLMPILTIPKRCRLVVREYGYLGAQDDPKPDGASYAADHDYDASVQEVCGMDGPPPTNPPPPPTGPVCTPFAYSGPNPYPESEDTFEHDGAAWARATLSPTLKTVSADLLWTTGPISIPTFTDVVVIHREPIELSYVYFCVTAGTVLNPPAGAFRGAEEDASYVTRLVR